MGYYYFWSSRILSCWTRLTVAAHSKCCSSGFVQEKKNEEPSEVINFKSPKTILLLRGSLTVVALWTTHFFFFGATPRFPRRHRFFHVRHIAFAKTNALAKTVSFLQRKKCKYNTTLFGKIGTTHSRRYLRGTSHLFWVCNYFKVYNKGTDACLSGMISPCSLSISHSLLLFSSSLSYRKTAFENPSKLWNVILCFSNCEAYSETKQPNFFICPVWAPRPRFRRLVLLSTLAILAIAVAN